MVSTLAQVLTHNYSVIFYHDCEMFLYVTLMHTRVVICYYLLL